MSTELQVDTRNSEPSTADRDVDTDLSKFSACSVAINTRILAIQLVQPARFLHSVLYAEGGWLFAASVPTKDGTVSWEGLQNLMNRKNHTKNRPGEEKSAAISPHQLRAGFQAFSQSSIHGIAVRPCPGNTGSEKVVVCVYGDHSYRLLAISAENFSECGSTSFATTIRPDAGERIADELIISAKFLAKNHLAVLLADNSIMIIGENSTANIACQDSSILYSGLLLGNKFTGDDDVDELLVIGGTVYNYLCFWAPSDQQRDRIAPTMHKLGGHAGVVFDIDYNHVRRLLCSTSDDRSCRVYSVNFVAVSGDAAPTVRSWRTAQFQFLHSLYGHEARVWRAKITSAHLVTVGEDARCCVWDISGAMLQSWISHSGINIWSLCVFETAGKLTVFTGGADGGIAVQQCFEGSSPSLPIETGSIQSPEHKRVRQLGILDFGRLIVLLDGGLLYEVDTAHKEWRLIWKDPELLRCVSIAPNRTNQVALLTCTGNIALFDCFQKETPTFCLDLRCNCMEALWVDSSDLLVVSGPFGSFWFLKARPGYQLEIIGTIPLISKNCWITAAAHTELFVVCGDRCGSLRIVDLEQVKEVFVDPHVHEEREVTQISFLNRENGNFLVTSGRSGHIIIWDYDFSNRDKLILNRLKVLQASKQVIEWVSGFVVHPEQLTLRIVSFGYRSSKFVVVDMESTTKVAEVACGGGHRSSSTIVSENNILRYVYVHTDSVNWVNTPLFFDQNSKLVLKDPLHALQIWSVEFLGTVVEADGLSCGVYATGCEDTVVKLVKVPLGLQRTPVSPIVVAACKSYLSSIRVVKTSCVHQNCLYAAGGRSQLSCWQSVGGWLSGNAVLTCQWTPYPVVRKRWSDVNNIDPDTRIMTLAVCEVADFEIVAAGISDGSISIFAVPSVKTIHLIGTVGPFPFCLLNVRLLVMEAKTTLIFCGTNGCVTLLDITDHVAEKLHYLRVFGETDLFVVLNDEDCIRSFKCHQSGVDALDLRLFGKQMYIASGGDDNGICVLKLNNTQELRDCSALRIENTNAHTAQISGIKFIGYSLILTASKDQLVKLWACNYDLGTIINLTSTTTYIADVSCMYVHMEPKGSLNTTISTEESAKQDEERMLCVNVAIAGAGFELLQMSMPVYPSCY